MILLRSKRWCIHRTRRAWAPCRNKRTNAEYSWRPDTRYAHGLHRQATDLRRKSLASEQTRLTTTGFQKNSLLYYLQKMSRRTAASGGGTPANQKETGCTRPQGVQISQYRLIAVVEYGTCRLLKKSTVLTTMKHTRYTKWRRNSGTDERRHLLREFLIVGSRFPPRVQVGMRCKKNQLVWCNVPA